MHAHVIPLALIVGLSILAWWVNETLNTIPVLKKVIQVVIVVIAILLVLQSLGLIGDSTSASLR
jgi:hypothetical protein